MLRIGRLDASSICGGAVDNKQQAQERYGDVAAELRTISHWLYENPEIAFQEHESSARLARFLGENGFEVEYPAHIPRHVWSTQSWYQGVSAGTFRGVSGVHFWNFHTPNDDHRLSVDHLPNVDDHLVDQSRRLHRDPRTRPA